MFMYAIEIILDGQRMGLPEHQVEFDRLKTILTSEMIVRHFDSSKETVLLTDASRLFGLGYALGHLETDNSTF